MRSFQELTDAGYSLKQIQQIQMANNEGCPCLDDLSPFCSEEIFRTMRTWLKKENFRELGIALSDIIDKINENEMNFDLLKNEHVEDLTIAIYAVYISTIFGEQYFNNLYAKNYNDGIRQNINSHYIDEGVDVSKYINYSRESIDKIALYLQENDKTELKTDITSTIYDTDTLEYILVHDGEEFYKEELEEGLTAAQRRLIHHLKEQNLDTSVVKEYKPEFVGVLLHYIDEGVSIDDIYDKCNDKYADLYILCKDYKKDPEILIKFKEEKMPNLMYQCIEKMYLFNATKDELETFIENFDKYEENETLGVRINTFERAKTYRYSNKSCTSKGLLNPAFDLNQMQTVAHAYEHGVDLGEYCDERYSIKQLDFIYEYIVRGKDVSKILDPKYTTDEMRAISFYTEKGISFDNPKDYLKNYVKDKNKDYDTFLKIYDDFKLMHNFDEKIIIVSAILKYNEKYNKQVNIEKIVENDNVLYNLDEFFKDLSKPNYDLELLWQKRIEPKQRSELRWAFEMGLDLDFFKENNSSIDTILDYIEQERQKECGEYEYEDDLIEKR